MDTSVTRRSFIMAPVALGVLSPRLFAAIPSDEPSPATEWPAFPLQNPAIVKEFVGLCHRDIDKVRALLKAHPALAKSAIDWGYGDWESALGAAAHTGRVEIAKLLLEHGARLDLFAAAMLGMTDVVRAMVKAQPGIESTPGPHGITLLAHAEAGEAAETIEYLRTLPGATTPTPKVLTADEMKPFLGEYRADNGRTLILSQSRFGLSAKADGGTDVRLVPTSPNQFHPAGAPNVRVTFTIVDGMARRVEIVESTWYFAATRAT